MASTNNFTPSAAGTKTVAATTTSSTTQLNQADVGCSALMITNAGTGTAFVLIGKGAQTALIAGSVPILAGQTMVFDKPIDADNVGVISASTSTVYIVPGEGQ